MHFFFVDESGTDKTSKYFVLGILCVQDTKLTYIKNGILAIKEKYLIPPSVEVKWNLNDFNRQLKKNSLPIVDPEKHKEIKNEFLNLICNCQPGEISVIWYFSPREYFSYDPWRSYRYAMNDVFQIVCSIAKSAEAEAVVLIDDLDNLKVKGEAKRSLLENYIHTVESQSDYDSIATIIPGINSNVSFGHQLNDITTGLINNYLTQIHNDDESKDASPDVIEAIQRVCPHIACDSEGKVFRVGVHIKPEVPRRSDLQNAQRKTYTRLRQDFDFK